MHTSKPLPKDSAFARDIISTLRRETKSKGARIAMAKLAIVKGNYTPEAKRVWSEYLKEEEGEG